MTDVEAVKKVRDSNRGFAKIAAGAAVLAAIFLVASGGFYTVDQGERGVILRYGAVVGTAEPGLGFKLPLIDKVVKITVQNRSQLYERVSTYSRDQQPAEITLSVNYRLPAEQVAKIYAEYGSEGGVVNRLIDRRVYEQVKNVFGQFNAVTAIQDRARLNAEAEAAIRDTVRGPVIIDSVQIENIDFSDAYEQSIENRMLAEVEVQKIRQNAEREKVQAQITVTQAQARADAVRAEAEANAAATRLAGEAEADAIKAKGAALRDNPELINLTAAEKWNGQLPSTMVPGSAVPFIGVK
ncbi:regulator of protease activity HflC (stomatin/prohibitin superfamily) [Rhizobium sp. SG_E_25_P2]|jgi:regulator of protease activity HflC (stomatin/prohibitin superfamily)|uniref:prohibitin family protein n=1 Tax=Rhizobium sp. SG_E_25_P2 TaxID=2879942 RepID=UPI0024731709|nr:prohibitin family protein [Rhizobium sp. SG_E_25_P2]MDH6267051.1 regulator of protease activity HflC (stomatin/prohibitin superfamily) [Rhizobium sp. SG_E_25_P2]